jgi:hypothetical protein
MGICKFITALEDGGGRHSSLQVGIKHILNKIILQQFNNRLVRGRVYPMHDRFYISASAEFPLSKKILHLK